MPAAPQASLQHKAGPQGPFLTESVPAKLAPLSYHKRGLSYTASGYGARQHLRRHILPFDYGARRDFPKIDLFDLCGRYLASTTWSRDCREALDHCLEAYSAQFA